MPELTILHTNDVHGRLYGLAQLTTVARREQDRAQAEGRAVYRWDGGDAFDRRFEPTRLTRGAALAPVLAAAGITLQTVGNDIGLVYGMTALSALAGRATFPMLAANLRDGEDGPLVEGLRESVLLGGPDGTNIAVFGLTDPWDGLYGVYGLHTPDVQPLAARLVEKLRGAGAGLVALLSHLGIDADRAMAAAVPGIDVIVGAHSHDLLPQGEWVGRTLIVQAGNYAEHLGRVDVTTDAAGRLVSATARVIAVAPDTEPDPEVMAALDTLDTELETIRHEVVGHLTTPLTLNHFGAAPVADVAAQALRERAGAEIGLIASGALHAGLDAGPVSYGALASAAPAPVNPLVSRVTGAALRMALERGLTPDIVSYRLRGLRGTPIGVPGLSGVQVRVEATAEPGQRSADVVVNGDPLDPARIYTVAHTDLDNEDYSFLHGDGVELVSSDSSEILEDILRSHLARHWPLDWRGTPAWIGLDGLKLDTGGADPPA